MDRFARSARGGPGGFFPARNRAGRIAGSLRRGRNEILWGRGRRVFLLVLFRRRAQASVRFGAAGKTRERRGGRGRSRYIRRRRDRVASRRIDLDRSE